VGLALALGAGASLPLAGLPLLPALLLPALLLAPIGASFRPRAVLALVSLAGVAASAAALRHGGADCRLGLPPTVDLVLEGRFEGRPHRGAAPFRVAQGLPGGCTGTLRVGLVEGVEPPLPGAPVRVSGRWRGAPHPHPLRPEFAGTLRGVRVEALPSGALPPAPLLVVRGRVQDRIGHLFGPRAPMVEALVLARKEGVGPELREQFALSGTAHLLAISGFHVGVVAGVLFTLVRASGLSRERGALLAAAGSWIYVLSIGAPHAAARAATLVAFLAASRLRGRPVHPAGALAAAALIMMVLDPGAPASISFQLSFAGAAGLVWLRAPLARQLRNRVGDRIPRGVQDAVVAGVAATLATTPLVAWHFDRISLVGIPATLVVGPVIALAIPGIFAALVLDVAIPPLGLFLAGAVSFLLLLVEGFVGWSAALPWASPWVSRQTMVALVAGAGATALLLRSVPGSRMRPGVRRGVVVAGALAVWVVLPLPGRIAGGGVLTLSFLDVGQGDAITLRTPGGRWIVVDAGPRGPGWDAGARVVLPHLRQGGARRIELMVLTHPHLDHVGGAGALLKGMEVGRVADPGLPSAGSFYLELLGLALEDRTGWWPLQAGDLWEVDGVELRVLHPVAGADTLAPSHGANSLSVILEVRFGEFRALLTGDAPEEIEEMLSAAGAISPVQVLKVGHHGSRTSTGWELLARAEPEVAVIPAGRGNSFGHPHPNVVERLERAGVRLFRTDRDGTVTIRAREDGGYQVASRGGNVDPLPQFPDFRRGTPAAPPGDSHRGAP